MVDSAAPLVCGLRRWVLDQPIVAITKLLSGMIGVGEIREYLHRQGILPVRRDDVGRAGNGKSRPRVEAKRVTQNCTASTAVDEASNRVSGPCGDRSL